MIIHTQGGLLLQTFGTRQCWLVANESKCPCDARGRPLKGWNTGPLLTYEQAARLLGGPVRYLGLRMDAVPELAALDLDAVLNAAGGHIDPVAASIWGHWPSYTEITPSGRGVRIWWRADPPAEPVTVQCPHELEMRTYDYAAGRLTPKTYRFGRELYYRASRFIIVTNQPYSWYPGAPGELATITPDDLAHIATLVRERRVHEDDLREPDWLPELEQPAEQAAAPQPPPPPPPPPPRQAARPSRPERGRARRRAIGGVVRWVAGQRPGNRNNATYWAAHRLREEGVTLEHAQALLVPVACALGLPEREVTRTIQSAYAYEGQL